jgi:uroporphyrinogen decarboxylase
MNKFEKIENAIHLGHVSGRQDIPVYAHMCAYAAVAAGITQKELFSGNDAWINALSRAYEVLEADPDAVFPLGPADITFGEQMKVRIPGRELGDNELFQFVEEKIMTEDDYQTVIEKGLYAWQFPYIASIQNPPIPMDEHLFERVGARFGELGMHMGQNIQYWAERGIPTFFHNSCFPAFDMFSLARGMEDFFYDLYDEPELVKAACDAATPAIIESTLQNTPPGSRICIWAMRSSSTFVSPDMFEEFCWPSLKQIIEAFHAKGMTSVIHADADWSLMLPYFKEVPKGSCIIELDGATDIVKAKEILNGYQCIAGDMPASILAFGSEKDTQDYCNKLIDLAKDGGFIIRSGCEIPLNAKEENLKLFLNCCR